MVRVIEVHTFAKGNNRNVNAVALLMFETAFFDSNTLTITSRALFPLKRMGSSQRLCVT